MGACIIKRKNLAVEINERDSKIVGLNAFAAAGWDVIEVSYGNEIGGHEDRSKGKPLIYQFSLQPTTA